MKVRVSPLSVEEIKRMEMWSRDGKCCMGTSCLGQVVDKKDLTQLLGWKATTGKVRGTRETPCSLSQMAEGCRQGYLRSLMLPSLLYCSNW